jgi:hypothetical protein
MVLGDAIAEVIANPYAGQGRLTAAVGSLDDQASTLGLVLGNAVTATVGHAKGVLGVQISRPGLKL